MLKKNYFYNLLLSTFNILFPILSFPYISRVLGPSGVGKVQFVITFAQYFALVAALGIPYYGVREIAKVRTSKPMLSKTFSELFCIHIITSVITAIFYISIIFYFNKFSTQLSLFLPTSVIILLSFSSIDWLYQGTESFRSIAFRSVIIKVISLLLTYVLVTQRDDLDLCLYINIFAILGNNLLNILMIHKITKVNLRTLDLKKHLSPLLYIFGTNLSIAMYNMLDTVLLGLLSDDNAVGYYTASIKIARIATPLVISAGLVLLPAISQSFQNNDDGYKKLITKSYHFIILIGIPISWGIFLLAPQLINLVSGPEFSSAILPMRILSPLPLLIGLGNLFGIQILISAGKEKEMLKSVLVGMALSLSLNYILVPSLGEVGAAIANSCSELTVTAMFFYFTRRNYTIELPIKNIISSISSCLTFVPIIYLLNIYISGPLNLILWATLSCGISYGLMEFFVFKNSYLQQLISSIFPKFNLRNN